MNTATVRLLILLLSVFIFVTIFSQVSMAFREEYETETALTYSSAEKVYMKGVYVRDETVIASNLAGALSYPLEDGGKAAKDSVVAYVYASEEDIYRERKIELLNSRLSVLEQSQKPGVTAAAQPEHISVLIDEKYRTITSLISKNELDRLHEERKNLQTLMNIYQIIVKEETDYNFQIGLIKEEIAALSAMRSEPLEEVITSESGYFISQADGLEGILTTERSNSITADQIKEITDGSGSAGTPYGAVGKIVDGYSWKMIGLIDPAMISVKTGGSVTVKFSGEPEAIDVAVEDIRPSGERESLIVLSCDRLTYNLAQRRVERVELILNDFEGLKVSRGAIRFSAGNEKGVYILMGNKVAFKKLDIIYEADDYVLSRITGEPEYLSLYDDIIIKGEITPEDMAVVSVPDDSSDSGEDAAREEDNGEGEESGLDEEAGAADNQGRDEAPTAES